MTIEVEGPYEIHDYTVAANTAIDKYSLCFISGSRIAAGSAAGTIDQPAAGIAASDKSITDSDTSTELGLWTTGTFELTNSAKIPLIVKGDLVKISGANTIALAVAADILSGHVIGRAQEAIGAEGSGEVKLMLI